MPGYSPVSFEKGGLMPSRNKVFLVLFGCFLVILIIVGFATGIFTFTESSTPPNTNVNPITSSVLIGKVPDDACVVNGNPLILNVETEIGWIHLTYIRKNGDIVIKSWYIADDGGGTWYVYKKDVFITGGKCPSQ